MKCPNCFAEIKYRERSNNQCTKCFGTFVFEPKTHPLGLTDTYFSKTVDKLSANGTIFFTLEQLQFALNRKKFRQADTFPFFFVVAIVTTILTFAFLASFGVFVASFWTIFLVYKKLNPTKTVSIKQTLSDFYDEVLMPWKKVHDKSPTHLITKNFENEDLKNALQGFLLCDQKSTVNFLLANNLEKILRVSITDEIDLPQRKNRLDLPIFVLHDANIEGYKFFEKAEKLYERNTKIFDIGLRPQDVKQFELLIFREPNPSGVNIRHLTDEENKWLTKGFYTPLFVLKPAPLLRFVNERIKRNLPTIEKSAK